MKRSFKVGSQDPRRRRRTIYGHNLRGGDVSGWGQDSSAATRILTPTGIMDSWNGIRIVRVRMKS